MFFLQQSSFSIVSFPSHEVDCVTLTYCTVIVTLIFIKLIESKINTQFCLQIVVCTCDALVLHFCCVCTSVVQKPLRNAHMINYTERKFKCVLFIEMGATCVVQFTSYISYVRLSLQPCFAFWVIRYSIDWCKYILGRTWRLMPKVVLSRRTYIKVRRCSFLPDFSSDYGDDLVGCNNFRICFHHVCLFAPSAWAEVLVHLKLSKVLDMNYTRLDYRLFVPQNFKIRPWVEVLWTISNQFFFKYPSISWF